MSPKKGGRKWFRNLKIGAKRYACTRCDLPLKQEHVSHHAHALHTLVRYLK